MKSTELALLAVTSYESKGPKCAIVSTEAYMVAKDLLEAVKLLEYVANPKINGCQISDNDLCEVACKSKEYATKLLENLNEQ